MPATRRFSNGSLNSCSAQVLKLCSANPLPLGMGKSWENSQGYGNTMGIQWFPGLMMVLQPFPRILNTAHKPWWSRGWNHIFGLNWICVIWTGDGIRDHPCSQKNQLPMMCKMLAFMTWSGVCPEIVERFAHRMQDPPRDLQPRLATRNSNPMWPREA